MNGDHIIALGFFDGVHLGHAGLLARTAEEGKAKGLVPAALSFDEHPLTRVSGRRVPLLTVPADRTALIRELFGIEESIVLRFNDEMMRMPWERFLDSLIEEYHAAHIVCGYDYSCGYRGLGTAERLARRCAELGIGCDVIDPVTVDGVRVSSSLIRELITEGRTEEALRYYGHPHMMTGIVRTGKKLGRTIDAPTINLRFDRDLIVPKHGVYASVVTLPDGRRLPGVTNVGVRPTVEDTTTVNAETYILDYSGDLYGRTVRLELFRFLRPEMRFSGIEELKRRIHADADTVRDYFSINGQYLSGRGTETEGGRR
ncbi:MAG: riboflavin biosynthesis protein RibF [Oscillospiraceae bacterium]|nr:riboflavin biosynthesis protein RibF [Oscillospiraceae bacterium]